MTKKFKSAADFMAIAACPALIMGLVWALVFFLLDMFYGGGWKGAMQWVLFWFVLAMVLVSRIAIQRTTGVALFYGTVLAGATSLLLLQYIGNRFSVFLFLGLVWWAAHKLTFDCTLIEDEDKTSGQGLMQAGKVDRFHARFSRMVRPANLLPEPVIKPQKKVRGKVTDARQTKDDQVHTPGVWILYFSLAAIPIFGVGEIFLENANEQTTAFSYLALYLACAIGLLLLTSFLGLRRYLRQRNLEMPTRMAFSWVSKGIFIMALIFAAAFLLPRPSTPYSLSSAITKITSPEQEASELPPILEEGAGKLGDPNAQTKNNPQADKERKTGEPTPSKTGPQQPLKTPTTTPVTMERMISWILALLIASFFFWYFRKQVRDFLAALWESLMNLFSFNKGSGPVQLKVRDKPIDVQKIVLQNPFMSGREPDPVTLVRQTFHGLQIWAEQKGFGAPRYETPLEFSERLCSGHPGIRNELLLVAKYYSHIAYANEAPPAESREAMLKLWQIMTPRLVRSR